MTIGQIIKMIHEASQKERAEKAFMNRSADLLLINELSQKAMLTGITYKVGPLKDGSFVEISYKDPYAQLKTEHGVYDQL